MPARTGEEYLAKLKENPPEVWIDGQRVRDPTTHPAFRRGARSMADLLDMQHEPALRDEMTYDSPSSGERVGTSFLTPRTPEDIVRRRLMMTRWARHSGGMMGRSPDYLNAGLMAVAAASSYFGGNRPEFKANVERYYEHVRENDLCMTHTLVNMRRTRSAESVMGADDVGLRVTRETDEGIVVKGARVLATLGPISDEIMVFPSTVLSTMPDAERYAFAFSIPSATAGLKFVCRESFDLGRPSYDHPLGSRFEEMDAIVLFDEVLVPWERVFLLGDIELCNDAYAATNALVHMMHQVVTKNVAKSEFVLGIAARMVEALGSGHLPNVQGMVAELIIDLELMKACLRAAEADAAIDEWGVMCPNRPPLDVARNLFPKMYPRMVEVLQLLGSSNLMATPSAADFESDIGEELEHYLSTDTMSGLDRARLFHLAWDVACSAFGSRQVLYERFFFGDQTRMASALYNGYDMGALKARVDDFLAREPMM